MHKQRHLIKTNKTSMCAIHKIKNNILIFHKLFQKEFQAIGIQTRRLLSSIVTNTVKLHIK